MNDPVPRVGVGVLIFKGKKFLVGQRKGSHGEGTFALPGGHLEFGESWETCARREVEEETGLVLDKVSFAHVNNNVMSDKLHYITIFMRAEVPEVRRFHLRKKISSAVWDPPIDHSADLRLEQDAEAKVMEPHKCVSWEWLPWPECPRPVFMPLEQLLAAAERGDFDPFAPAATRS